MSELNKSIIQNCEDSWEEEWITGKKNKNNCSGFVKAVASKVNIFLPPTADADYLIAEIFRKKWYKLRSGKEAAQQASTGVFVVAGLLSDEHADDTTVHGHVVVVVDGPLAFEKYPTCWGGSIAETGRGGRCQGLTLNYAWNCDDRDNVTYHVWRPVLRKYSCGASGSW
jgi:hypothetical protein